MTFSAIFDKYVCTKVDIVSGYTDSSGNWIAATSTDASGNAHISDVSIQERSFIDPVIVNAGVRKMSVESSRGIVPGDYVKITELDGTTNTEWDVVSKLTASQLFKTYLGESRETFLIKRRT